MWNYSLCFHSCIIKLKSNMEFSEKRNGFNFCPHGPALVERVRKSFPGSEATADSGGGGGGWRRVDDLSYTFNCDHSCCQRLVMGKWLKHSLFELKIDKNLIVVLQFLLHKNKLCTHSWWDLSRKWIIKLCNCCTEAVVPLPPPRSPSHPQLKRATLRMRSKSHWETVDTLL